MADVSYITDIGIIIEELENGHADNSIRDVLVITFDENNMPYLLASPGLPIERAVCAIEAVKLKLLDSL